METIVDILKKYDVRLVNAQKDRLINRLAMMLAMNFQHHFGNDLSDLIGIQGSSDFHLSVMERRATKAGMLRLLSPIELLRFGSDPGRFHAQPRGTNRYWHRGSGELWNDTLGGSVQIQIIQPVEGEVEGDRSVRPILELYSENFPMESSTVVYVGVRK